MNRNTKITGSVFSTAALSALFYYNAFYVGNVHDALDESKAKYVSSQHNEQTHAQNLSLENQLAEKVCKAKGIQNAFIVGDTLELESSVDSAFDLLEVQVSKRDSFCSTFLANLDHT